MSGNTHVLDFLPAYSLGCLEADETVQVSQHLARCAACLFEFEAYQAVADQLALAAPAAAPNPAAKARLMRRVAPPPARLLWLHNLLDLTRRAAPVWAAAGILLVMGLLVSNFWLWQQVRQRPVTPMQTVPLVADNTAPDARGLIVISPDGDFGSLVVDHLPPLDTTYQYQLWLIQNGQRTSGAVFSVGPHGYGVVEIIAPQPLSNYSAFGITVEPAGGSPGPTGARVLSGSL